MTTTITAGGMLTLLEAAWRAIPAVEELPIDEIWVGHRPGSRDDAPILGRGPLEGLFYATGHHRNGILLAPVTADAMARLILDDVPSRRSGRSGSNAFCRRARRSRSRYGRTSHPRERRERTACSGDARSVAGGKGRRYRRARHRGRAQRLSRSARGLARHAAASRATASRSCAPGKAADGIRLQGEQLCPIRSSLPARNSARGCFSAPPVIRTAK